MVEKASVVKKLELTDIAKFKNVAKRMKSLNTAGGSDGKGRKLKIKVASKTKNLASMEDNSIKNTGKLVKTKSITIGNEKVKIRVHKPDIENLAQQNAAFNKVYAQTERSKMSDELSSDDDPGTNADNISQIYNNNNAIFNDNLTSRSHSHAHGLQKHIHDVIDDKGHKMKFKYTVANTQMPNVDKNELYCNLCCDEIDKVLGYYSCEECKTDLCKECSVERHKMEMDIAENPILIPTPLHDLNESHLMKAKEFNGAIIKNELDKKFCKHETDKVNHMVGEALSSN